MKKIYLLLFIQIISIGVFSQEQLSPILSESFGLNNHTNRDESYFSHIDTYQNAYIIGTTERDSTFTDILTTKLDANLNVIWQKRLSIETSLSYDIPVKSFITNTNDIIIVGRSSFNESNSNGLIFITKYDEYGNLLFNKTIGNIDGSDYTDYGYLNVTMNDDRTMNLVYSTYNSENNLYSSFKFLKIGENGEINNSFSKEINYNAIIGVIKENVYYFFLSVEDEETSDYSFEFVKVIDESNHSAMEVTGTVFESYFNNIVLSEQVQLNIDDDENLYLSSCNTSDNDTKEIINFSKIDTNNNELLYSINSLESDSYYLIDSYINSENENIGIANNLNTDKIEFIKIVDGELVKQENTSDILATGFKMNNDGSFFITTSSTNIRLFSEEMTELKSFNSSDSYSLVDFSKINDEEILTIGTSLDKMFEDSDYYSQLDIQAEKINELEVINNYSFSGEGTSKLISQRLIIDNEGNYLVFVNENMGPEYLGKFGATPPLNQRVIKYDSNFNKIWEVEAPEDVYNIVYQGNLIIEYYFDEDNNLFLNLPGPGEYYSGTGYSIYKLTPNGVFEPQFNSYVFHKFHENENYIYLGWNYSLEDLSKLWVLNKSDGSLIEEIEIEDEYFVDLFTIDSDYYFYTSDNSTLSSSSFIYFYKNGEKIFTRELDSNYGISPYKIDEKGTLYFATDYSLDKRINRLDINNNYTYYALDANVKDFEIFNNGKLYVYLENGNSLILDENLEFITAGESIDAYNSIYIIPWSNYLLFNSSFDSSLRIIDQNGNVNKYFTMEGFLGDGYYSFDNDNNLIVVGSFGNKIYTYNEYSWERGFIYNYGVLDNSEGEFDDDEDGVQNYTDLCANTPIGEVVNEFGCSDSQIDDDNDGVFNDKDICPNTPEGEVVSSSGCIQLSADNFTIQTISETCPNSNNGQLYIEASTTHNYQFEFFNTTYYFTSKTGFPYVIPGVYNICIEEPNVTTKQCFTIEIKAANEISGKIDINGKSASIEVDFGTPPYSVLINGEVIETTSSNFINVEVEKGDLLEVTTSKDCEGKISEVIKLEEFSSAYPNPTTGNVEILLDINDKFAQIQIFKADSKLIFTNTYTVSNGRVILDLTNYSDGVYFIKVITENNLYPIKLIKN